MQKQVRHIAVEVTKRSKLSSKQMIVVCWVSFGSDDNRVAFRWQQPIIMTDIHTNSRRNSLAETPFTMIIIQE